VPCAEPVDSDGEAALGASTTPSQEDHILAVVSESPAETNQIGEQLGRVLDSGSVVCLRGDLGSGKTCLTQGIGRGLGVLGVIHSPTFVFINEHPAQAGALCLYHVDLYRIHDLADAYAIGLDEYMYADGVTVIEWAERASEMMPLDCLWVHLSYVDDHSRRIVFQALGPRYEGILARLRVAISVPAKAAGDATDEET
jgi:tRNA threonylcarbamoyladenosine biosynthesis protein TsaE